MFESASRNKYRFESPKGFLTTEDLWDLPLTSTTGKINLDDIAKGLHAALKNTAETSFVIKESKPNELLKAKLELVKHIIGVRIAEMEAAVLAHGKAIEKQKLYAALAQKEDEKLSSASIEELRAQIAALEA